MEKEKWVRRRIKVCQPFEEERRRIRNLIDDFLNCLKKIKNEFIASKWDDIEKLRMELRFLRTFVLFGNSNLDYFYVRMSMNIYKFSYLADSIFIGNEFILAKYNMDSLAPYLLKEIKSYLRLKNVAIMTEENMLEYRDSLLKHLHDLPKYCSDFLLPLMREYKILREVCRHLRDFYELECNKSTTTEFLYARYQMTVDRVAQFCFDLWTGNYTHYDNEYAVSEYSSKITSLLIDIIPLELEVLYISTSELIKESRSTELEGFVNQILKASPRILQNYLIHLQGRMAGAVAVNYAPTQSINVMMEFLLIFLTDIPKRFIHREKLNDMLAHAGVLTRKISILVSKLLEEISENNINEADFSAPDFLQEIEQMKGDIRQIFLKTPESSQLRFPMDDGFLFMNLLLRHLNDLLISNVYSVTLMKKEIGMVKESLEFLTSSFRKVTKTLDDTSGVVKDCWLHALDVAYEAEHVINSILVRDKALSHLIFSLPNVTDKIKLIVAQVTDLQLEDKNGDEPLDAKSSNEPIELTSSSFFEVTVGHEEDEARIIGQLLDEHESELDVISIVGMPGLGKTTLANKVYNNTLVASHFNVRAKCTVSQKYNKSKKCKGLPLAIVLIAGVIVRGREGKKKEKDLWLQIEHNMDSFISSNNNSQMMKVMQLSYDHLPCHLKPLLLYFARSQKSIQTPVSTLMQLWMAEGLVDHDSLEEATQTYLAALISSSLIMVDHIPSESISCTSVMIKACYIHDVVHDFCSVKAKKEKFFKLINSGDPFHASDYLHRRLAFHTDDYRQLHKKCDLFNSNKCSAGSKHLISLTVSGSLDNYRFINHTRHLRLLRVLQLDNFSDFEDDVLEDSLIEEIGSLFHLRFLSIWANMEAIPESWVNLQNLETLLINTENTMVLLPRLFKLSKLKHVSIDHSSFFEEDGADESRILEGEISKLTNLSHVDILYSESTNDALKKFPNLEHLECTIGILKDPPTHGDWFPKFDVLNKLESLFVRYPWDRCGFPIEYYFPTSLKELRLYNISMRPDLLSAIAALPHLEILAISESYSMEDKWDASEDIYQNLKTLTLREASLSEWDVDRETFPKLEELIVEQCYKLTEIPCAFMDIHTLKSIHLTNIKRELGDSAIAIKKDIAAYTGEDRLDVHISHVYERRVRQYSRRGDLNLFNRSKEIEIPQQVPHVSGGNEIEDDPADKLRRALLDKRYLIVLDDVWDTATGEIEPFSVMIKVCYVHDVVHDFCSVKAKKEKLFKLINSGDPFHASDYLHRRLTVHTDDYSQLHKRCVLFNFNKCSAGSKHLISLTVSGYLDDSSKALEI
ncbi:hypothetical protein H5410_019744 [Solanum commersonii]|uniref:NB-ARC domain-containing protein n=1 Tax=Solanum commersonii TaxID=4109 RepID=A0A9J5Z975_SOLCO|nr:hypothetical protein H5410_019744 [Solanum commersonii]